MCYEQRIIELIESDRNRMRALRAVSTLGLSDWLVSAGFVRNAVWDHIFDTSTELNDIDVIYFCKSNTTAEEDRRLECKLKAIEPAFPWSVKNQARMHRKNGDKQYKSTLDAMSFWPEKETSIGSKLNQQGKVELLHSFGLELQFSGTISHNPARAIEVFNKRVLGKGWLEKWPKLQIKTLQVCEPD